MAKTTKKSAPNKKEKGLAGLKGLVGSNAGPPRNRELEDAIILDPDDSGGILVYGDWLQARNDPRGTLIALQQAAREEKSKKSDAAVAAFLKEHDQALTGLCGTHRTKVQLEWGLGFFYGATIRFSSTSEVISALGEILSHPSGCFLQELVIQPPKANQTLDFDAIAAVLEKDAPKTLRYLLLGRPGQWSIPESIYDALPRLRQEDKTSWRDALDAVRGQRKLKTNVDGKKLPRLEPRDRNLKLDSADLDGDIIAMGIRMELDKGRDMRLIESMKQVFTVDSLDRFALAMLEQWIANGERSPDRWIYNAVGSIGGHECVANIGARLAEMSHQRATTGMGHLARIGSNAAIGEIVSVSITPSRFAPRREHADQELSAIAKSRGVTARQLIRETAPRTVHGSARERAVQTQRRWLFDLMVHGERMSAEDFFLHVTHHSIRAPLARGLLWATWAGESPEHLFRIGDDPDEAVLGRDGNSIAIPGDARVGVPHAIELSDDDLASWAVHLAAPPPFSQLDRQTYHLTDMERGSDTLTRFARRRVGFHRIREGLEEADWFPYTDHGIEGFGRRFRRGKNITIVAHIGTENTGAVGEVYAQKASERWMSTHHLPLAGIHPAVISEALLNIEHAIGQRGSAQPQRTESLAAESRTASTPTKPSAPGLPQRGRYPFAELAKSSRSKCVICGEKIEKQTVRIGVERMIETPNFTGKATAWLHHSCAATCPELQAIDDLDARLTANSAGVWPPSDSV